MNKRKLKLFAIFFKDFFFIIYLLANNFHVRE